MNIRLEYSEMEGKFNKAQATDKTDIEKGYRTLCCFVNAERALRFTQAMEEKFPALSFTNGQPFPSFSKIKDELYHFMAEDIQLLEQHMNKTYERRKQLFSNRS